MAVRVMSGGNALTRRSKCALLILTGASAFAREVLLRLQSAFADLTFRFAPEPRLRAPAQSDQRSAAGPRPASCRRRRRQLAACSSWFFFIGGRNRALQGFSVAVRVMSGGNALTAGNKNSRRLFLIPASAFAREVLLRLQSASADLTFRFAPGPRLRAPAQSDQRSAAGPRPASCRWRCR